MMDLRELYQEVILDHNRNPRNFYVMTDPSGHAEGYNPLCGDQVKVYLQIEDECVIHLSFQGKGCAICTASASLMTEALVGKDLATVETVFQRFHQAIMSTAPSTESDPTLGKLAVLLGVKAFPSRVKCATLAWHTLKAAVAKSDAIATTE